MEWVVLSIGGAIINPEGIPDVKYIKEVRQIIEKSKYNFGIVTGGGKIARVYAEAARLLGANEFEADEIGIANTRQNALLFAIALKKLASPTVFHDFEKAREAANYHKVILMGGTIPGITTDTDAALLAETLRAKRLINLSNVGAVYDSDPKINKNAKKLNRMTHEELLELAMKSDERKAGTNFVFDAVACKIILRSKIETHFVDGRNLDEVQKAIEGKEHNGTIVK